MMKMFSVDLYEESGEPKPKGRAGILECYIPEVTPEVNGNRRLPCMLILPGGGYAATCDRESEAVALKYLSYGFACFSLRYSCAPNRYPVPLYEACLAVKYIRQNAARFHLDGERISSVGFSAGGHLCCMLGSVGENRDIDVGEDLKNLQPKASILCYPVVSSDEAIAHAGSFDNLCGGDDALRRRLSCENFMTKNSAPVFLFGTASDEAVNVLNGIKAIECAAKNGVPFSAHIYGKGQHGLSTADKLAYRTDAMPSFTESANQWVALSVEWLEESGLAVKD